MIVKFLLQKTSTFISGVSSLVLHQFCTVTGVISQTINTMCPSKDRDVLPVEKSRVGLVLPSRWFPQIFQGGKWHGVVSVDPDTSRHSRHLIQFRLSVSTSDSKDPSFEVLQETLPLKRFLWNLFNYSLLIGMYSIGYVCRFRCVSW